MTDVRSHFHFTHLPFTREVPVRDQWHSTDLDEATEALVAVVDKRMSAALIGPAGCGKTQILRALDDRLADARYDVRYIKVTALGRRDFCREIAVALDLPIVGSYPFLVREIQEMFRRRFGDDGRRPVLLIDEAHDLRPEVLAVIRILTNFEMDSRLVLSVILAGQPPLERLLENINANDIRGRLAHVARIGLLSRDETERYLEHRLTLAGAKSRILDPAAKDALYEISRGNLRALDHLALASLEIAAKDARPVVYANTIVAARKGLLL